MQGEKERRSPLRAHETLKLCSCHMTATLSYLCSHPRTLRIRDPSDASEAPPGGWPSPALPPRCRGALLHQPSASRTRGDMSRL